MLKFKNRTTGKWFIYHVAYPLQIDNMHMVEAK